MWTRSLVGYRATKKKANWKRETVRKGKERKEGGGYSIYPWVGRCGPAPHTLTLFKTKIADFPTLFKTEFRFLIPCLRHLISIRACKNFAVYRPRKDILLKTKNDKPIPWLRQKSRKHTLAGRTSPLSPYKGGPPRGKSSCDPHHPLSGACPHQ